MALLFVFSDSSPLAVKFSATTANMDIFKKVEQGFSGLFGSDEQKHSHTHDGEACHDLHAEHKENRFQSFAPQTSGQVKWHVDGCSYFWALSEALEGQT